MPGHASLNIVPSETQALYRPGARVLLGGSHPSQEKTQNALPCTEPLLVLLPTEGTYSNGHPSGDHLVQS